MPPASKFTRSLGLSAIRPLIIFLFAICIISITESYAFAQSKTIVLYAAEADVKVGNWTPVADAAAAGGAKLSSIDYGAAKQLIPLAAPTSYFEMTFDAVAGQPYHLWVRGKAESNSYNNDSVYMQFNGSTDSNGGANYRIGTTSAATVILEDCRGCGLSGWGWQDNGYGTGVLGPAIYFAQSGAQTIRVQIREDGFSIDQIVLSPQTYLNASPGAAYNDSTIVSQSEIITTTTAVPLKLLQWNIDKGRGTDYAYDLDRTATYIARVNPDLVLSCEVMRSGSDDQPQRLAALLKQKTGVAWYYHWFAKYAGDNEGNLILSKYPLQSKGGEYLSYQRSVAQVSIIVNSRMINIFATHLDNDSATCRKVQVNELQSYLSGFAEDKIVGGDFNASSGTTEILDMKSSFYDSWAQAVGGKVATSYADNPVGLSTRTRRGRIDYVFYSGHATHLNLGSAQMVDTRDLKNPNVSYRLGTPDDLGVRPSDHNQTVIKFSVD